jgi:hypothetical protein
MRTPADEKLSCTNYSSIDAESFSGNRRRRQDQQNRRPGDEVVDFRRETAGATRTFPDLADRLGCGRTCAQIPGSVAQMRCVPIQETHSSRWEESGRYHLVRKSLRSHVVTSAESGTRLASREIALGCAIPTQYPHTTRRRSLKRSAASSFEGRNRRGKRSCLRAPGRAVRVNWSGIAFVTADSATTTLMMPRLPRQRACRLLGALVALSSWAWLTPKDTSAGCAARHYIVAARNGGVDSPALDLVSLGLASEPRTPEPVRQCAGLTCAKDPTPPVAPGTSVTVRIDTWVWMPSRLSVPPLDGSGTARSHEPSVHTWHVRGSIERPPRSI